MSLFRFLPPFLSPLPADPGAESRPLVSVVYRIVTALVQYAIWRTFQAARRFIARWIWAPRYLDTTKNYFQSSLRLGDQHESGVSRLETPDSSMHSASKLPGVTAALETQHSSEAPVVIDPLESQDPECPHAARPVLVLEDVDLPDPHWVATEFVYFVDIPWDTDLQDRLDPSHGARTQENVGTRSGTTIEGLTLGVLEGIMDATIPLEYLLSSTAGRAVLSGHNLSRLVVPWARRLADTVAGDENDLVSRQRGQRIKNTLITAITSLDDTIYASGTSLMEYSSDAELVCAVVIFFASLSRCLYAIWQDTDASVWLDGNTRIVGEVSYLLRDKLQKTWGDQSSFELERMLAGGLPFAAYASTCPPTTNNVTTVDTDNYKPAHVTAACDCPFIKPPIGDVRDILSCGDIPVVMFDGTQLTVHRANVSYVAVSHVWADGLGSSTEEGLPTCQVSKLTHLAQELLPSGAFWQDGLCVPREKDLRKKAIALMAETYTRADKVLVIDAGVRSQCNISMPKEECLLRIATSGWVQRIWTLQEGMLAQQLHFQLGDSIVDCTYFNGTVYQMAHAIVPLLKYRRGDDSSRCYQLRSLEPPRCTVNDLIPLLRYRSTSHPEDEAVAIAGLLGVDAAELVHLTTGEERMKALLMHIRKVPRQVVVFGWFAQRLTLRNFTWAPTSLSDILWPSLLSEDPDATCTEDGLLAEFTVIRFPPIILPEWYGIVIHLPDRDEPGSNVTVTAYNLVLSPYYFRVPHPRILRIDAILLKSRNLPETIREEAVGTVELHQRLQPSDPHAPLPCKYVAPASFRLGLPDTAATIRDRQAWLHVHGTIVTPTNVLIQ